MLHSVDFYLVTDVSGQFNSPTFNGQAAHEVIDCLTLEVGQIGCPETSVTTNIRCVTSHKSQRSLRLIDL